MTISVISIDIGLKNMAIAYVSIEDYRITSIDYSLYNLDDYGTKKKSLGIVVQRCTAVREIFDLVISKSRSEYFDYVIIEKQVPSNENAMCIMYSLYMMATNYLNYDKVILFDPKMKFTSLSLNYETKNKNHKKLSIELVRKCLHNLQFPTLLDTLEHETKKDDIADSINQAIIWLYRENYISSQDIISIYELNHSADT